MEVGVVASPVVVVVPSPPPVVPRAARRGVELLLELWDNAAAALVPEPDAVRCTAR